MRLRSIIRKKVSFRFNSYLLTFFLTTTAFSILAIHYIVPSFYISQGDKLSDQKKLDEAIASYQKAIQLQPDDAYGYTSLAHSLRKQGKLDEAIAAYQKAIQLRPNYVYYYIFLGDGLREQGKLDEAIAAYQKAIHIQPNDVYGYTNLALTLREQGKLDKAIAAYQKAIQLRPDYVYGYIFLGDGLREQGKLDEAIAVNQKAIQLEPNNALGYILLGNTLKLQGKLSEAIAAYQKAAQLDPKDTSANESLSLTQRDYKQLQEAIAANQTIKFNPNNGFAASAYNDLGMELAKQKKLYEAIAAYQKAIQLVPNYPDAYKNLGVVLMKLEQIGAAIAAYQKAIQLAPNYIVAPYNNLGDMLYRQNKLDEALVAYRKFIQLDPKNAIGYNNLGRVLNNQGKFYEAVTAYRQAIQLDPSDAYVYSNLGNTLQQQGKLEAAIGQFKRAIALEPSDRWLQNNLKEAQRLLAWRQNPQLLLLPERLPSQKQDPLVSLKRSVVRIIHKNPAGIVWGTGWVVKRQGSKAWIVTNRHVVTDENIPDRNGKFEVEFYSQPPSGQFHRRESAQIAQTTAARDSLDLAVLEITGIPNDIQPLPMSEVPVSIGTPIHVIGNPGTGSHWTVAKGKVSGKDGQGVKITAAIAPGNSGSPLLNQHNYVVGVVVEGLIDGWSGNIETASSGYAERMDLVMKQLQNWGI
jgi:superkiller protein 3